MQISNGFDLQGFEYKRREGIGVGEGEEILTRPHFCVFLAEIETEVRFNRVQLGWCEAQRLGDALVRPPVTLR
jgi:hypothetical protein